MKHLCHQIIWKSYEAQIEFEIEFISSIKFDRENIRIFFEKVKMDIWEINGKRWNSSYF